MNVLSKRYCRIAFIVLLAVVSSPVSAQTADVTYTLGSFAGTVQPLLGINAGPLHNGWDRTAKDVTVGFQSIGVRSVRTHDFPGAFDMGVMYPDRTKDPTLQSSYNFSTGGVSDYGSDYAATSIQNAGLTLYLRIWGGAAPSLTERANWVSAAVEVVRHYHEGKWNGFTNLVTHVEIGNEPDSVNFWPSIYTAQEFYALYSDTAKAIRAAFPTLKIGGPGVTQGSYTNLKQWTTDFLDYVKNNSAPLDFFSWHTYSNVPNDFTNGSIYLGTELTRRGLSGTEQHVTEWHTAVQPTDDPILDAANLETRTMGKAAAITTASWISLQQAGIQQAFIYRANDPSSTETSRYGLFTADGLPRKPALAFSLWSEFAGYTNRIDPAASATVSGLKALAAQRSDGQIAVLVANTGTASKRYTIGFSDTRRLSDYALSLKTVDDSHALLDVTTPTGTSFDIAANTAQLLTLHVRTGSFSASSTSFGTSAGMLLGANLQVAGADIGNTGLVYLAALVGNSFYFNNGTGWLPYTSGDFPPYSNGALPAVLSVPVFSTATNAAPLAGVQLFMGYGSSANEMVSTGRYRSIYTVTNN